MPTQRTCPQCHSSVIKRSHRRPWERILFFLKPLRCQHCLHRYYVMKHPKLPKETL